MRLLDLFGFIHFVTTEEIKPTHLVNNTNTFSFLFFASKHKQKNKLCVAGTLRPSSPINLTSII